MITLPHRFNWPSRKPIGSLFVTNYKNQSGFHGDDADPVKALEVYANQWAIPTLKKLGAQGMIVWDMEGKLAVPGLYLGCPELANPSLAIPFFQYFRNAGFKTGCCIRPVEWNNVTKQIEPSSDPYASLLKHAKFAHRYWGCTMFYIDSNYFFGPQWQPFSILSSAIFERLHKAMPDCLWIPEQEMVWGVGANDHGYWQNTAPYMELRMDEPGTPGSVLEVIPDAFSVVNVSEGDLVSYASRLKARRGLDIPMVVGWWDSPWLKDLLNILQGA